MSSVPSIHDVAELGEVPVTDEANEADATISDADLEACIKVLCIVSQDRSVLEETRLRPVRKALHGLLDGLRDRLPDKSALDKNEKRKCEKLMKRQRQQIRMDADKRWIDNAQMRRARLGALGELQNEQPQHAALRIPDGAVIASSPVLVPPSRVSALVDAGSASAPQASEGAECQDASVVVDGAGECAELLQPRACYACHRRFTTLHHFYDRFCPLCAVLNWQKRLQSPSLPSDFIAFVSGGRVKIGFEVVRKLLHCGARVIATSRFPRDCCERFAALPDYSSFADRLHIYGVDFRSLDSVHRLCAELSSRCPHLDAVVHNACQTVRRPARYYRDVARREHELTCQAGLTPVCLALPGPVIDSSEGNDGALSLAMSTFSELGPLSAILSQKVVLPEDTQTFEREMPDGAVDVNGQQLDLREKHSWKLRLHEVSTEELVECLCVNTVTPFVLNARLKELLLLSPRPQRFIVNVSAMEGKFYRTKTANHPHTNMAKAALNMMTRTSAQDYAAEGIFMNSVDTGWINDENPLPTAHRIATEHNFQSPLDEVDAAARILDPIFDPITSGSAPLWGKFLKDYAESEW